MSRQPNKPRLRVHRYGGDTSAWHFMVSEYVKERGRLVLTSLAWGQATHYDDAMAAGRNALRRIVDGRGAPPEEKSAETVNVTKVDDRPVLTAASHLASSERRWSFGFSAGHEVWT